MSNAKSEEVKALIAQLKTDKTPLKKAGHITPDGTVVAWSDYAIVCKGGRKEETAKTIVVGGKHLTEDSTVQELATALKL